jgi:hypothetical protein
MLTRAWGYRWTLADRKEPAVVQEHGGPQQELGVEGVHGGPRSGTARGIPPRKRVRQAADLDDLILLARQAGQSLEALGDPLPIGLPE